jgi:putative methyltransferase (TIGR04325 family)
MVSPAHILRWVERRLIKPRTYETWEAAKVAAGSYQSDIVTRFRVERSAGREVDGSLLRSSLLAAAIELADDDAIQITDFGGATGDLGLDVLRAHPAARYTVVETEALVARIGARGRVAFTTAIPAACDIFFTSGTVQYLDDPMGALRRGFESARRFAVLARNSFADREVIRVQRSGLFENGSGPVPKGFRDRTISYPHRTLVEREVRHLAQECGLTCVAAVDEVGGAVAGSYGRGLIFQRM